MELTFDLLQTLGVAVLVFIVGRWIKSKVKWWINCEYSNFYFASKPNFRN